MKPNEILELPIFTFIQTELKQDGWQLTKYDNKQRVWFAYRTYGDEEDPKALTLTIVFDENFTQVVTSYVEFPRYYTIHNDYECGYVECAFMAVKKEEKRITQVINKFINIQASSVLERIFKNI